MENVLFFAIHESRDFDVYFMERLARAKFSQKAFLLFNLPADLLKSELSCGQGMPTCLGSDLSTGAHIWKGPSGTFQEKGV